MIKSFEWNGKKDDENNNDNIPLSIKRIARFCGLTSLYVILGVLLGFPAGFIFMAVITKIFGVVW